MKQKDLLFILLSLTFVVGLWIVFNILHTTLTSTINPGTAENIAPITATFDTKTLSRLKKRQVIAPQSSIPVSPTPTPLPLVTPSLPESPLQLPTPPTASQGGVST